MRIKIPTIDLTKKILRKQILNEVFLCIKELSGILPEETYCEVNVPDQLILIEFYLTQGNVNIEIDFEHSTINIWGDVYEDYKTVWETLSEKF